MHTQTAYERAPVPRKWVYWLCAITVVSLGLAARAADADPEARAVELAIEPGERGSQAPPLPSEERAPDTPERRTDEPTGPEAAVSSGATGTPPAEPTPAPEVPKAPTPPSHSQASEGPGGCEGVAASLRSSETDRRAAAAAADPSSRADRLQEYLLADPPYEGWLLEYDGDVSDEERESGFRAFRETPEMFEGHGYVAGYLRTWHSGQSSSTPSGGVALAYVQEFASTDDAIAFDEESWARACDRAAATFTVSGVDGATGVSLRDAGAQVDEEVTFVRGPRRYIVILQLSKHFDYDRIREIAQAQAGFAR